MKETEGQQTAVKRTAVPGEISLETKRRDSECPFSQICTQQIAGPNRVHHESAEKSELVGRGY